jgi:hypothetical protein
MSRPWIAVCLTLAACGRTTTYEAWRLEAVAADAGSGGGTGGSGGGNAGGGMGGGGNEVAPGCTADELRFTGQAPTPPPAGIPRLQFLLPPGAGLTGSAPWFDWSTGLLAGTARKAGEATFTFESVKVRVRVDSGDTSATIAERLLRCARIPGYRFETTPAPNTFIGVRRADSQVFARIFADNSLIQPRFVSEDDEGIPYWLSIMDAPGEAPLMLAARGKPICGGGAAAREPAEKKIGTKGSVLFSWDGTHFKDAGTCLERVMHDPATVFLIACARVAPKAPGADPFSRPDGGVAVDCIGQQAVVGPVAPGTPVAIVFNW